MSVGECTSLDVLASESNVEAFVKKGSQSNSFCCGKVNSSFICDTLSTLVIDFFYHWMNIEILRNVSNSFPYFLNDI